MENGYQKNDIELLIQPLFGEAAKISIDEFDTIGELKKKIATIANIRREDQNLIHFGEVLKDDNKTLLQCKVLDKDTIVVTRKMVFS